MKLIEFPIDDSGNFKVSGITPHNALTASCHWTQWNGPIAARAAGNFSNPCKIFAGWHYPSLGWFMHPILVMYGNDGQPVAIEVYSNGDSADIEPIEPDKIRYWSDKE